MIKSGSGIIQIWEHPITDMENPDVTLQPQHQLNPIRVNVSPLIHEVTTDDSQEADRRYNKGIKTKITISITEMELGLIKGFLPGLSFPETFNNQIISIGQQTGQSLSDYTIRILPNPINELSQDWKNSVITLKTCSLFTENTEIDFGINAQKNWKITAQSTSRSLLQFGLS